MYKVPERDKKFGVGKRMGDNLYFQFDYAEEILGEKRFSKAKKIARKAWEDKYGSFPKEGLSTQVLKYNEKAQKVSFIFCEDFYDTLEPGITGYITVDLNTESGIIRWYKQNYPIYHHSWLMVKDDFKNFAHFTIEEMKIRSECIANVINSNMFDIDTKKIGMFNYWEFEIRPILCRLKKWRKVVMSNKTCDSTTEALRVLHM